MGGLTVALLILKLLLAPMMISAPLPHKGVRSDSVNYVVIHYDNSNNENVRDVVKYLKRRHKSYHYIIARDGTIYKLVDPKYEATHAGISRWDGHITLNDKSIGIALNNNSRDPYTDEQYISLIWLIKQLQDRYPDITTDRIVGHSDVAWPRGRKQDPGNHFEWERLRSILAPQQVTYDSTNDSLAGNDSQDSLLQPIQHVGELPEAVEAEIR